MKTDDLITMLATGATAVDTGAVWRRLAWATGLGILGAAFLMFTLLGVRADLAAAARLPMFWLKFAYVGGLAAAALVAVLRLSRPGVRLGRVGAGLVAPLFAMWVLAAVALLQAAPDAREHLFFGDTWSTCPFLLAMVSSPAFITSFWALRGLAPTRLRLAGAAAGLFSGSLGAVAYSLHCPELAAPFLGFWYLLGMLIPTAMGAWLGPRLLRW